MRRDLRAQVGALMVTGGINFVKRHPVFFSSWAVGLLLFSFFAGYAPTAEQQALFEVAAQKTAPLAAMRAELEDDVMRTKFAYEQSKGTLRVGIVYLKRTPNEMRKGLGFVTHVTLSAADTIGEVRCEAGWFWQCDSVCQSNKAEYDAVMLQYNGLLNEERQHWSDAKAGP